jgi:hypothetical protein
MMTYLTEHQAGLLTGYVASLRPDWGSAGIMAALARNHQKAPAHIITTALINIAANPEARTPALLDHEGPHWEHARGTILAAKPKPPIPADTNDPWCTDHPHHHLSNCPACRPMKTPMPANIKTQLKNILKGQTP